MILYGIKNCTSVKKALQWLEQQHKQVQYHDFRDDGLTSNELQAWVHQVGWQVLLNKRSLSFRNLDDNDKQDLTETKAVALMLANPTLIKRPVLSYNNQIIVGFSANHYQEIFDR